MSTYMCTLCMSKRTEASLVRGSIIRRSQGVQTPISYDRMDRRWCTATQRSLTRPQEVTKYYPASVAQALGRQGCGFYSRSGHVWKQPVDVFSRRCRSLFQISKHTLRGGLKQSQGTDTCCKGRHAGHTAQEDPHTRRPHAAGFCLCEMPEAADPETQGDERLPGPGGEGW